MIEPQILSISELRRRWAQAAAFPDRTREIWVEQFILAHGQQWGDQPPTREEAIRAYDEMLAHRAATCPHCGQAITEPKE